jgi:hypothetical protein
VVGLSAKIPPNSLYPYTGRSSQDDVVGSSPRGSSYPASVAVAVAVAVASRRGRQNTS